MENFDEAAFDEFESEAVEAGKENDEYANDPIRKHIAKEEFQNLSPTERNQLALERWHKSKKSNWQIGQIYERYVGHFYAMQGYSVAYFGANKGLNDLGRDLIVKKNGTTLIAQCKYWAKHKEIHEKHIFQLYGSVVEYEFFNQGDIVELPLFEKSEKLQNVRGVLFTSARLSERAKKFADFLGIEVIEEHPLGEYPAIICNISNDTKDKIYHLPMDQQYNKIRVENKSQIEFAFTVREAETMGYRRAYRWRGDNRNGSNL